jgi:hypothetical protein
MQTFAQNFACSILMQGMAIKAEKHNRFRAICILFRSDLLDILKNRLTIDGT